MLFSKEVIELYAKILEADDIWDRQMMMIDMAHLYTMDMDPTDETVDENLHQIIEEVREAKAKSDRNALLLGRLLMRVMSESELQAIEEPANTEEAPKAN